MICFFFDIVANFRTGILDHVTGKVRYSKKLIAKSYLRGWFFIDFISTFPFEVAMSLVSSGSGDSTAYLTAKLARVTKALRLIKLLRLRKLGQVFSTAEDRVFINQAVISLLKVVLTVLFVSHIMACIWFYIAMDNLEESWAAPFSDEDLPRKDLLQYLAAVYWSLSTMTTVGYGDIHAVNDKERLVSIFVMVISVSVFGYVIGNIANLVENLDASGRMRRQRLTTIKEYLISRELPKASCIAIRDHFEYYYGKRSVFNSLRPAC